MRRIADERKDEGEQAVTAAEARERQHTSTRSNPEEPRELRTCHSSLASPFSSLPFSLSSLFGLLLQREWEKDGEKGGKEAREELPRS